MEASFPDSDLPILDAQVIPVEQYDKLRSRGRSLGESSAKLVYTQEGRAEADKFLDGMRAKIKNLSGRVFQVPKDRQNEQILYEIDSGVLTGSEPGFEDKFLELKRARLLAKDLDPILDEDSIKTGFAKEVFTKGVKDGWQEVVNESQFKNETQKPWYLIKE